MKDLVYKKINYNYIFFKYIKRLGVNNESKDCNGKKRKTKTRV